MYDKYIKDAESLQVQNVEDGIPKTFLEMLVKETTSDN